MVFEGLFLAKSTTFDADYAGGTHICGWLGTDHQTMDAFPPFNLQSGNCYGGKRRMPLIPMGIVQVILQHVALTELLTVCALVSKAWADAAAWSTVQVDHGVPPEYFSAFASWLEQHALRLSSLQLPLEESDLSQLPLLQLPPSLQSLECLDLQHLSLALPAPQHSTAGHTSSSTAAPVALLPRLRELKLKRCKVDGLGSIVRLTQASSIARLELCSVSFADIVGDPFDLDIEPEASMESVLRVQGAVSHMLEQLPGLHVLRLNHDLLSPAAVQQVSAMPRLQELSIEMPHLSSDGAAASLPSTLTCLELVCRNQDPEDFDDPEQAFPHFLSGLHTLPHLLTLDISGCTVNPGAISNMPGLQHLRLMECELLHVVQPDGSFTAGPRVVLDCLPKLVHLRHLELAVPGLADSAKQSPELFAGLTASSHLTCLRGWSQRALSPCLGVLSGTCSRARRCCSWRFSHSATLNLTAMSWRMMTTMNGASTQSTWQPSCPAVEA